VLHETTTEKLKMKKTLGILAVTLLSLSLGFSQTADRTTNTADSTQNDRTTDRGPEHNWGWIRLLGLAGLGGLAGRKRDVTHHREEGTFRKAA
jgi:hypothetical protein